MTDTTDPAAAHRVYIARITGVEVTAALARRHRVGDISSSALTAVFSQFREEFAPVYRVVEMTAGILADAMRLAETGALRGHDAVQLAAALLVHTECAALGLAVEDPTR